MSDGAIAYPTSVDVDIFLQNLPQEDGIDAEVLDEFNGLDEDLEGALSGNLDVLTRLAQVSSIFRTRTCIQFISGRSPGQVCCRSRRQRTKNSCR